MPRGRLPALAMSFAIRLPALVAALAFTAGLGATLCAQPVALPNPGFEEGLKGWFVSASDQGRSTASPEAARTGKCGLRIYDRDTKSGSSLYLNRFRIAPGATYEVTFWGRNVEGSGLSVHMIFVDAAGKHMSPEHKYQCSLPALQYAWGKRILHATAPEGATHATLWIRSYVPNTVLAWLDDFTLTRVPASAGGEALRQQQAVSYSIPEWMSEARRLPAFPKPFPEKAFTDGHLPLKLPGTDGSPLRTPREDWENARRLVATDPHWKKWLASGRRETDAWMTRHPHDRADWRAGYYHAFISPRDSSFLVWEDRIPGEETDTFRSRSGHEVKVTPALLNAWVFGFRSRHVGKATEAARLYRITGEERYASWAAAQIDYYAQNLPNWPLHPNIHEHSRLGYQALDDTLWVSGLTETVRLLDGYPGLTPERRRMWFEQFFRPQADMLSGNYQVIHNKGVWHRATEARVALLFDDDAMWRRALEGPWGLREQFRRGVTSDYFWYEQSLDYNNFIINATHPLLLFAGLLGKGHLLREEAAMIQNLMLAPLMIRFPDGVLPNPADSTQILRAPSPWLKDGYRVLPTVWGIARLQEQRRQNTAMGWSTLLDPPEAISLVTEVKKEAADSGAPLPELPPVVSRSMESTRFALLRRGPWQVFFHYGQIASSHAQAEALNWSASLDGVDVTHDPGTVGYGSPLYRGYYTRGLCHNVPLVNGEGQTPADPGKLLLFDPARAIVIAAQPRYRPDASAARTLRIDGEGADARLVDEVTVALTDPLTPDACLGLALHLQGTPHLSDAFAPVDRDAFLSAHSEPFRQWNDIRAATFSDTATLSVTLAGGRRMSIRFSTTGKFILVHADTPDAPPGHRCGFYIEKTGPARSATFTTEFIPE
ncbi:heparinase [Opitutaceae bacterium TAV5]|nr:heparinase [Opitutaceae bacterium TAV5]